MEWSVAMILMQLLLFFAKTLCLKVIYCFWSLPIILILFCFLYEKSILNSPSKFTNWWFQSPRNGIIFPQMKQSNNDPRLSRTYACMSVEKHGACSRYIPIARLENGDRRREVVRVKEREIPPSIVSKSVLQNLQRRSLFHQRKIPCIIIIIMAFVLACLDTRCHHRERERESEREREMEGGAVPGGESNKKQKLMQGDGSSSSSAGKTSKLEALTKELEQKNCKIQELKRQIEATKHRLEGKKKVPEEQMEVLKSLIKKYNSIREEHEALLANKSRNIYYK
ncbi:uncharacterized protein LOC122293895 isoform X1 [Carya illinoinensis]|uniref:uncharacterized protein LOC122293895 isoform X1 n=1 Tax=Carya illinoinensis TaxID=32201 RepID=UPI001C727612|nr:uncharacterized protein LOC122293895 isoform X1 [Carya illinoinensis]